MTANMYRVGDYVYFETSSSSPYQIRRIEELNKTASGNVEAKVMCFYRRRDLPSQLIQLADKHQCALDETTNPIAPVSITAAIATVAEATSIVSASGIVAGGSGVGGSGSSSSGGSSSTDLLNPKQRHQMKHRELFLSRQVETLPATHIRGKCSVTLFNETEALASYLNKDDMFFYCLVFDPTQKTLLADKGEIRVGSRYQCEVPGGGDTATEYNREPSDLETLVWTPEHNLSDRQIDQFLVVSRSVGTFARALDCSSSVKQPSLHMSAAAASRDITLFHAMDTLHRHNYDLSSALCSLVPSSGPVLCRDEMEEWSASEANLFEEALDKYCKDFNDIRQDFLPWKTLKNIIEYYYMWKTTDRYVQQKRLKAVEAESKLKQVYIPNYNKPNPAALNNNKGSSGGGGGGVSGSVVNGSSNGSSDPAVSLGGKACESCNVTVSNQWYAWGPPHVQCRLCQTCWQYWKKYGGLKIPTRFADSEFENGSKKKSGSDNEDERMSAQSHRPHRCNIGGCGKEFKLKAHLGRHYATAHGIVVRSGSPRPIMKTRTAFYLNTTPITRISRRLCRSIMRPRHAARAPFFAINIQAVKQECGVQMAGKSLVELKQLLVYSKKNRGSVTDIATRLGRPGPVTQWLILTDKALLPKPDKVAFPKPPKAPDGSLMYERVPNKPEAEKIPLNNMSPSLKKRAFDEMNGIDSGAGAVGGLGVGVTSGVGGGVGSTVVSALHTSHSHHPPTKRIIKEPMQVTRSDQFHAMMVSSGQALPRHIAQINGKPKIAHMTRTGSGRKQVISWMDAPDDVYFRATEDSKKVRRQVTLAELRRAARKPWRQLKSKMDEAVVVLD